MQINPFDNIYIIFNLYVYIQIFFTDRLLGNNFPP